MRLKPLAACLLLLLAATAFAGCFGSDESADANAAADRRGDDTLGGLDADAADANPLRIEAPWWDVGAHWTIAYDQGDGARTLRLVSFWNDSATDHFWLGVEDRDVALEHALFRSVPFLGRVHHGILAPHQTGTHAVMYNFPLEPGKSWQGPLLGTTWNFRATLGEGGAFLVEGSASDGSSKSITFDYDASTRWFSRLAIRDGDAALLDARITDHGIGATGTYYFLHGREHYSLDENGVAGSLEPLATPEFEVPVDDERTSLTLHAELSSSGPFLLELLDPAGEVRSRHALLDVLGGTLRVTEEIPDAEAGLWTLRYVGTSAATGDLRVVGIREISRTL